MTRHKISFEICVLPQGRGGSQQWRADATEAGEPFLSRTGATKEDALEALVRSGDVLLRYLVYGVKP